MRKKFLLALTAVVVVAGLSVGGTFALFTDTTATVDNTFTAGTLCIFDKRNQGDPGTDPTFYVDAASANGGLVSNYTGLWAPGDSHERYLNITNDLACSTLDAYLDTFQVTPTTNTGNLDQVLYLEVYARRGSAHIKVAEGTLSDFATPTPMRYVDTNEKVPLLLDATQDLKLVVTLPLSTGNTYQGADLVTDFIITAIQMSHVSP